MTILPPGGMLARGFSEGTTFQWPLVQARELFELKYGKALVESGRRAGAIPVFGTNGQCGWHDTALFKGPGVVLGRKGQGPLGVEWVETDYWVIDTAYSLAPLRNDIDLKFAYYLLKYVGLNHLKDGTSNPSLSRDTFGAQVFPFPPFEVQRATAHILGTLDDKIELNRRMNATLEAMAEAIFISWFSKQMASGSAKENSVELLFNQGILQVGDGYRAKNDELGLTGLPFARAGNIDNGFSFEEADLLREESVQKAADKMSRPYDVVFTSKGTVGRFAFVAPAMQPFVYSPQLCFWRSLDHERLNPFVLRQWMQSRWFLDQVDRVKGQTDMAEYVSLRDQRQMQLPLPPHAEQREVSRLLESLQQKVWNNVAESNSLAHCRDSLLPRLLSGELSVRHAEHFLEATP
ncbi:restriction endonuclease subunit S [Pyxidicoccus caerfyrddinensis]|uniref:restriction endonuclease subunit S n=1 Tax=Pyxidicoccus caerfyrddinensis TaxID=2709663 RepID=UPI0013DC3C8E|nr:restriction endonuclease subunit S [Pyxidicoccus caerfyrddinensis]